jgi:hypothetical protein
VLNSLSTVVKIELIAGFIMKIIFADYSSLFLTNEHQDSAAVCNKNFVPFQSINK